MYSLSAAGKRTAIILLVAALIIWAFALWSLRTTLGTVPGETLGFGAAMARNIEAGLGVSQLIPALLMIGLVVATPLVCWNILEEYAATYTPTEQGLRYESIGIALTYPWQIIVGMEQAANVEKNIRLHLRGDTHTMIHNPLVRWLHSQAAGRESLLVYANVEGRDELLNEITARMEQQ